MNLLTTYWIAGTVKHGPLGFGVTAFSLDDAFRLLELSGYGRFLPEDLATLDVKEDVAFADLEQNHVRPNIGPMPVRGIWYPFSQLGTPYGYGE
jgi:hypothetical protein